MRLINCKKGFRSKGFSETIPSTNEDYGNLIKELWQIIKKPNLYKSKPLKRTLVPKPKGGLRPISVPTYIDRALQHLFRFGLDVVCEEYSDPNSFGFRPFRSPGWASKAVTLAFWSRKNFGPPSFAIEFDVAKCYDTIDHDYILNHAGIIKIQEKNLITIPREILTQWLKCGYILSDDKGKTILETTGVPQGGPISPTICNIVFNGLEPFMKQQIDENEHVIKDAFQEKNSEMGIKWEFSFNGEPIFCNLPSAKNQLRK
jgi:retron-type reverse transcriptase